MRHIGRTRPLRQDPRACIPAQSKTQPQLVATGLKDSWRRPADTRLRAQRRGLASRTLTRCLPPLRRTIVHAGGSVARTKKPESPCNEMKLLERYEPHGCIAGPPSAPFPPVSKLHETCAGHGHTSPNIDARGPGGSHATKKACPAFSSRPWTPPPRDSAAWSFHFCMFRVVRFVCNALFSGMRRPWEPDE